MGGPDTSTLHLLLSNLQPGEYSLATEPITDTPPHSSDPAVALLLRAQIPNAPTPLKPGPERVRERQAGDRCMEKLWTHLRVKANDDPTRLKISMTHAANWVLAVAKVCAPGDGILGIGVDLESRHRKIRPGLDRKILDPLESRLQLNTLEFWVIKEACFKADPDNSGRMIWDYHVQTFERSKSQGSALMPEKGREFDYCLHSDEHWITAFAFCKR